MNVLVPLDAIPVEAICHATPAGDVEIKDKKIESSRDVDVDDPRDDLVVEALAVSRRHHVVLDVAHDRFQYLSAD
jgi:hypothetical protein